MVHILPHVNAALNSLAAVLLVVGYVLIKGADRGAGGKLSDRERAHKRVMLAAFAVSVVFLGCYVTYHAMLEGNVKRFPTDTATAIRYSYYAILASHVLLAIAVPPLAVATIWFGLRDRRVAHRRLARWTFPVWLYVSITGVVVYLMLYQIYAR